jgi:hypothetical protein
MKLALDTLPMYCHECGDCLLWALGRNSQGYPQARLDGKPWLVQRYVAAVLLGRAIPPRSVVTTRCGEKLCVSPAHVFVQTRSSVMRRCYATNRRMHAAEYARRLQSMQARGQVKLSWGLVEQIRARPASETTAQIAREFGASVRAVANVRAFRTWRYHMAAASVFSWRP